MTITEQPTWTTRPASVADLGDINGCFMAMLRGLAPLGHDVLPTKHNVAYYGANVFGPALDLDDHGIFLAYDADERPIGCTFFVPESTPLELRNKRAIAHGIWVDPAYRQQGLALLLQDQAHAHLRDHGYDELISNVVRDNTAGMRSCTAAGAVIVGYMTSVQLKGAY